MHRLHSHCTDSVIIESYRLISTSAINIAPLLNITRGERFQKLVLYRPMIYNLNFLRRQRLKVAVTVSHVLYCEETIYYVEKNTASMVMKTQATSKLRVTVRTGN